jgi:hypothetical protein
MANSPGSGWLFSVLGRNLQAHAPAVAGAGFWASAGVAAIVYYSLSTILSGATLGTHVVAFLRQRMPELFAVRDHRAHA